MECGLIGGALLFLSIYSVGTWCLRALRAYGQRQDRTGMPVVVAVSVSALVAITHGLVDFVWYVPAYAAALAVLTGLACCLYRNAPSPAADLPKQEPTPSQSRWFGRSAWGFGLAVCWLGTSLLVGRHFVEQARAQHAWNAYLTLLPETDQPRVVPEDS